MIDQGIGIPKNRHSAIFQYFEQADGSTTRQFGGTGLGLAITKNIVDLMGGKIWFKSEPENGSTFFVQIPLKAAPSQLSTADQTSLQDYRFSKDNVILTIEDNLMNQYLIEATLEQLGLSSHFANNGEQGIEKTLQLQAKGRLDLILMDMHMPKMDGIAATQKIRQSPECATIPIIAISADAFTEQIKSALDIGISDYITKPVDVQKLLPLLEKYLQQTTAPEMVTLIQKE